MRKFKDIKLDVSRAKYWLGVGAQPSDPAWRLLSMVCSRLSHMHYVDGEILDKQKDEMAFPGERTLWKRDNHVNVERIILSARMTNRSNRLV